VQTYDTSFYVENMVNIIYDSNNHAVYMHDCAVLCELVDRGNCGKFVTRACDKITCCMRGLRLTNVNL